MEKLFDENNEFESDYYRTIWYGYVEGNLDKELQDAIIALIKSDLSQKQEHPPAATHWVFYGAAQNEDAIGETVRPSLMIRERQGGFVANCSMSDFDFVSAFDVMQNFKTELETRLNA